MFYLNCNNLSSSFLRIKDIEDGLLPKIKLEDQMFNRFSALSHSLRVEDADGHYKQRQLEEHWGLWFKGISNLLSEEKECPLIIPREAFLINVVTTSLSSVGGR